MVQKKPACPHRSPLFHVGMILAIILVMALVAHFVMQMGTRHGARCRVPDFAGMPLKEASALAHKQGLKLHINDSLFVPAYQGGIILDQLPEVGVEVKPGRTVYITINSFRQKMVPIPYIAGRSLRQAKNMLEIGGLGIEELVYREDMATNYVLEEWFDGVQITAESQMEAEMGSGVTLYVGVEADKQTTYAPLLIGSSLKAAKSRLWESGLNVGKITYDEGINLLNQKEARVYQQSIAAESPLQLGARVSLRLTLDAEVLEKERKTAEQQAKVRAEERMKQEEAAADSLARLALEEAFAPTEEADGESAEEAYATDLFFE